MSPHKLRALIIDNAGSTIFSAGFIKRTTGEFRVMQCRLGVRSYPKGGEQPYNPAKHGLLTVFDVSKNGYRSIPLDNVDWIKLRGTVYYGPAHVEGGGH